jgi:hypothetical protein
MAPGAWPGFGELVLTETEAGIVVREVVSGTADVVNPAPRIPRETTTTTQKNRLFFGE